MILALKRRRGEDSKLSRTQEPPVGLRGAHYALRFSSAYIQARAGSLTSCSESGNSRPSLVKGSIRNLPSAVGTLLIADSKYIVTDLYSVSRVRLSYRT